MYIDCRYPILERSTKGETLFTFFILFPSVSPSWPNLVNSFFPTPIQKQV